MEIKVALTPMYVNNEQCRPNRTMDPASVTIHNTANLKANAQQHAKAQMAGNLDCAVHYFVDDKEIYKCLEDHWQGWHAGDGGNYAGGNYTSIGIEVCEHSGIDQKKAFENAAWLVNELCTTNGFTAIKKHKDWSGKYCPHILLDGKDGLTWEWFLNTVQSYRTLVEEPLPSLDNTPADWARVSLNKALERGILIGDQNGDLKLHAPLTLERLLVLLDRCGTLG